MSLKRVLENPEVKLMFKEEFTKPRFKYNTLINAEQLTQNYSVIGIAFDYLARFHIERVNPNIQIISRPWIAETYIIRSFLIPGIEADYKMIIDMVKDAKEEFVLEKEVVHDRFLLEPLIKMSRIDMIHRSGNRDIDVFEKVDSKDMEDLVNLYELFTQHDWSAKEVCFLNPVFNEASLMVGGADADLIIDDVLVDFKTVKAAGMKRTDFDQLMGYYLLNEIGGIMGSEEKHTINKVAVYSSRYGEIMTLEIKDIFDIERLPAVKQRFIELCKRVR